MTQPERLIVGLSGASGIVYGVRLLEALRSLPVEAHLVMSKSAEVTLAHETNLKVSEVQALAEVTLAHETSLKVSEVQALADVWYPATDMGAALSSGSFRTLGMVVAPCSMRSLAEIAGGVTTSLLTRAADVVLKERRRLVLMVRETPLHSGHLRNMLQVSDMGAVIAPPVPAFYARPANLDEMIDQTVGRVLDLFGLDSDEVRRWGEPAAEGERPLRSLRHPKGG